MERNQTEKNINEKTAHHKFVEKYSSYVKYIDVKNLESHAIGDQEKLIKMKKKMEEKSH